MRKNLAFASLLLICGLSTSLLASINLNTKAVQESVVFLYPAVPGTHLVDGDSSRAVGTGFLVRIPSKADSGRGALVLITARHIVEPSWAYCPGPDPEVIFMRVNKPNYDPGKDKSGVDYLALPLRKGKDPNYLVNPDDRVDAAVLILEPTEYPGFLVNMTIPISDFASDEELKFLGIGDPIASAGLVPGKSGENRNYPFFKFGNISSVPAEGTFTACGASRPALRLVRVWFIAANLVPGNSGSPIYYLPPGGNGVSLGGRAMVLGVQSSSILEADLACMTPIKDVLKIIEDHFAGGNLYRGVPKGQ
jgi:hypothetical protein